MIDGLFTGGSMPALDKLMAFTGARHKVLTHNIANLNTPYFEPLELDPARFHAAMSKAVDQRRQHGGGGELEMDDDVLVPRRENILFHDRNNRDLEKLMQNLAENTLAHNAGIQLLKSEFDLLKTAIRERV